MSDYEKGVKFTLSKEQMTKEEALDMVTDGLQKLMKANQLYDIEVIITEKNKVDSNYPAEVVGELENVPAEYLDLTTPEEAKEWSSNQDFNKRED